MPMPADENKVRCFEILNGESYEFRVLDFGGMGVKIELYDPRDMDIADGNRLSAVILKPRAVRELTHWILKR